jgi:hypothetical protein
MNPMAGGGFGGWGRGMGWGRGRGGRGWRNRFYATGVPGWARFVAPGYGPAPPQVSEKQEMESLKAQAEYMEGALKDIRERMAEVEAEVKKK